MGRSSALPQDVVELLWQLGYGGRLLRVPDQDAGGRRGRSRAVLVDLLRRAEVVVAEKGEADTATVRAAWDTVRAEGSRYGLSVEPMHRLMRQAGRDIARWWQRERRRRRELRRRPDAVAALALYHDARAWIVRGDDPRGVEMPILRLAAESVSEAWWHRPEAGLLIDFGLIYEAARLTVLRMHLYSVERQALIAAARWGLALGLARKMEGCVEAGGMAGDWDLRNSEEVSREADGLSVACSDADGP